MAPRKKLNSEISVAVGMSGGVDSSLAAAILKKEGYDVIGMTFRMWPKEECGQSVSRACCSLEAVTRARAVAGDLGIPYYVVDFSAEFKKYVIDYFCSEYLRGLTPNPCIICNQRIKFGLMLDKARLLGAAYIATGHYAKVGIDKKSKRFLLKEAEDGIKDQSYFLFNLSQSQLRYSIFPLDGMVKEDVRALAKKMKVRTYDTVSSQDICFIQDKKYAEYIKKKTSADIRPGDIVDKDGKVLGQHKGIVHYTIGQRRGLGVAYKEPLYVTGLDTVNNRVIAGEKRELEKKVVIADRLNWIAMEKIEKPMRLKAKIRYNHEKADSTVTSIGTDVVRVDFDKPQLAPTPGQAVVFYEKDLVVGGGWIKDAW